MRVGRRPRVDLTRSDRIWAGVSALAAGGSALATLAYVRGHAFTSDDVAIQNIVDSVLRGNALQPALGNDNFIVKVPLYLLVGAVLPNGTVALTLTVLLCNAPLVLALLMIGRKMLKGASQRRLLIGGGIICAYLASQLVEYAPTIEPNGRNGEIGIALILLWWRFGSRREGRGRAIAGAVVAAALWALLFFSDLFFLFVLVPTAVITVVVVTVLGGTWRQVRRPATEIFVGGVIGWWLVGRASSAGFVISQNFASGTPAADDVPSLMAATFAAVGRDLNSDIWGKALGTALLPSAAQFAVTVAAIVASVYLLTRCRELQDPRVVVLLVGAVLNCALYVVTSNAADELNFRYVFFAAVIFLLLAVRTVAFLPLPSAPGAIRRLMALGSWGLVGVVVLGFVLNCAAVVRSAGNVSQPRSKQIAALAEQHGAFVGVGSYWDANVTTYFSQARVRVLPESCTESGFAAFPWLINIPEMEAISRATFVVLSEGNGCTAAAAQASFGKPADTEDLEGGDQIWFYREALQP